jgi:myosin heavy subunit
MKFKTRLPLSGGSLEASGPFNDMPSQHAPASTTTVATAPPPPTQTQTQADKSDGEVLASAFEAVAQVVRREIESLKRSIVGLETQMVRRMDSEKENLNAAISALRQDLGSRASEMRESQQKAFGEMAEQSKASIVSLRGQFEQVRQQTTARAEEIKASVEQLVTAKEQRLEKEIEALTHRMSGMKVELEQQMANAGRVSNLLNDIAHVCQDPKALPKDPQRGGAS